MYRIWLSIFVPLFLCAALPCEAASLPARPVVKRAAVSGTATIIQLAERGDAAAQARLGHMYETGRGVPQNYRLAAVWYSRAAHQGHSGAQYLLAFMFDRGFGVPPDHIEAQKWMILAAASAQNPRDAEIYARMRNAIATKLNRWENDEAQARAIVWHPVLEN